MAMMNDPSAAVKDSVAWLLSKIIEAMPELVLVSDFFNLLMNALAAGLEMEPRVAVNCCWVRFSVFVTDNVGYALCCGQAPRVR